MAIDRITTGAVLDGAIATADIADNAVTTAKITDANITTAKIADAKITTAKVADANITTAKVADNAVTSAKINYPLTGFSSTGIDDNADALAMTIDSSERVLVGTTSAVIIGSGGIALKGADEPLREKLFNCMSKRAAANIVDEMEALGPVRLTEVQTAQKEITKIASSQNGLATSSDIPWKEQKRLLGGCFH